MRESLLAWVRLFDGRLWHVAEEFTASSWTACGRRIDIDQDRLAEVTHGGPPANGWVCDRCVRRLAEQAAAARQAWLQDPRRRPGDLLPGPDAEGPPGGEIRANHIPADVTTADHDEQEDEH